MIVTYRRRLRLEGLTLVGCGAIGSIALLLSTDQAVRRPLSTAGQLVVVAALLGWFGPRGVRRSIAASAAVTAGHAGGGEPTPLWHTLAGVAGLTTIAGLLGGWDAGLRVTLGCVLVGLAQAVLLERIVAARERTSERVFIRLDGSSWWRGTRLGYRGTGPGRSAGPA